MPELRTDLRYRDFLQVLKNENDLVEIVAEVDPHLEAGAIMRKVYENKLPVPYFKNLKKDPRNPDPDNLFNMVGCNAGLRGFGNDHARVALHLGLDSQTPMNEIIDYLLEAKKKPFIPPQVITDQAEAAVKKNKLSGDHIRLDALPAPYLHDEDGGKYIQTYGMFILQTPDKTWTNWSIARAMIYDDKHITGLVLNPQHIEQVSLAWKAVGKENEIPFCLCFGVPPAAIMVSSMPVPKNVSENEYIGAIIGEPLKVIKAETNDLLVPVDSEMVLEGTLNIDKKVPEGPFGEMHGYVFPGTAHPCPLYTVEMMTYRDEAILPVSNPGLCTDETHTFIGGLMSAEAKQMAKEHPILSKVIKECFTPYEAQALWMAMQVDTKELVKLNTSSAEFCKLVGEYFFADKVCYPIHEIILVGDDIDIFNFRKLIWAYTTRHTPGDDQYFFEEYKAFPLAPFISLGPRMAEKKGGLCVTDCLLPPQYTKADFRFTTCDFDGYNTATKKQVCERWGEYGYQ